MLISTKALLPSSPWSRIGRVSWRFSSERPWSKIEWAGYKLRQRCQKTLSVTLHFSKSWCGITKASLPAAFNPFKKFVGYRIGWFSDLLMVTREMVMGADIPSAWKPPKAFSPACLEAPLVASRLSKGSALEIPRAASSARIACACSASCTAGASQSQGSLDQNIFNLRPSHDRAEQQLQNYSVWSFKVEFNRQNTPRARLRARLRATLLCSSTFGLPWTLAPGMVPFQTPQKWQKLQN